MFMKLNNLSRTHQLVLGAIMAAINVIFALISSYIFAFSLLIMLFLPVASIVVALNVDLKFYPVYLLGTLLLAFIINFANFENTLFFLLPILTSGLAFGLLIKHNVYDFLILIIVALINVLTLFITIPLINLIYDINFMIVFASFLGFNDTDFGLLILPSVLTLLAFMQTLITLFIVTQDAKYFRFTINTKKWKYMGFANIFATMLVFGFMFINESIALALIVFAIFISVHSLIHLFIEHALSGLITLSVTLLFAFSGNALFNAYTSYPYYFGLLLGIIPIVISEVLWLYISSKRKRIAN